VEVIVLACEALAAAELSLDDHWGGSSEAGEENEDEFHGFGE